MACPKCGCKVSYQYDDGDDCGQTDDRLERCAACGEVFDIDDHADEDDESEVEFRTAPDPSRKHDDRP